MSEMTDVEAFERFSEGMKRAASRARELGVSQKSNDWGNVANMLDGIRTNGEKMYRARALSRQDVLKMLDERQKEKTH